MGVGADRASDVLDELEKKVGDMLTIRRQTVIHRNGSMTAPTPRVSSSSENDLPSSVPATKPAPPETKADDSVDTNPVAPTGTPTRAPVSLSFAGARFDLRDEGDDTITYVSDEDAAKNAVAPLESMGLAGKWQQAGEVKIKIQNSGPAGAAVSLMFQVRGGTALQSSTTSLATWGIELAA